MARAACNLAEVWRKACKAAIRRRGGPKLFSWEASASDVKSRAAPELLSKVYSEGRTLRDHVNGELSRKVLEDAHEADAAVVAAATVDELARELAPAELLSSAAVEMLAARVASFLLAIKDVKGMDAYKQHKKGIKSTMSAGDIIAGANGETAFERRVAKTLRRTGAGAK